MIGRLGVMPQPFDRLRRALTTLATAGLAVAAVATAANAQLTAAPGAGGPRIGPIPGIGPVGPGPIIPPTTIPRPSGVPTTPGAGPIPTAIPSGGPPVVPTGGPPVVPAGVPPVAPTGGPPVAPTGVPTVTPTATPLPGATPRTPVATPNQYIDPRVGDFSTNAQGSHYSMGANPNCSSYRSFEGFGGRPCGSNTRRRVVQSSGDGGKQPPKNAAKNAAKRAPSVATAVAAADAVPGEIIIEVDGTVTEAQAIALAERHRLTRVESQNFPLIGATMFRWRIPDSRSVDNVARRLLAEGTVRSVQHNFRIKLQQAETARNDPGQYAIGKLLLLEAHAVTKGDDVRIAVIDSGIDVSHPELAGSIAGTYDALRSTEGPHTHGTGIAGAIVARSRLLGSAPSARLLAIRAFGATNSGAESTSFVVLKGLNYAVEQGAQIINMSFAGPKDPLLERGLAAAAKRGIILIAAAGNAGPKSPPLYPAADRNVIAVSATDATDKLFEASNRGSHMALAAPGVDLLLPSPDEKYQVASGTSFAAAYVSGLAALIVERNPGVSPDVVRRILTETARDLGPKGKDDQYGWGLANALAAIQAARPVTAGANTRAIELPKATR
jgi:subtilisin family serine protease